MTTGISRTEARFREDFVDRPGHEAKASVVTRHSESGALDVAVIQFILVGLFYLIQVATGAGLEWPGLTLFAVSLAALIAVGVRSLIRSRRAWAFLEDHTRRLGRRRYRSTRRSRTSSSPRDDGA